MIVSLIGIVDDQVRELSLVHDWIFTYETIKAEGMILADKVIKYFEFKLSKQFREFNIFEKDEAEKEFENRMKEVYRKHGVEAVRNVNLK